MLRIGGITATLGIRMRQQRIPRERFHGKCVRRVKIEILFKTACPPL
jgi:hypothetical protein